MGNNLLGWQTSRVYNSKHLSSLSTIGSTSTGNHCNPSLMSFSPLAPAFLPQYQSSSNLPIASSHPNTMNLPLAQLIFGITPQTIPPLAPSVNQHLIDSSSFLPLLQPINQSTTDASAHKPTPGPSTHLPSSLQHQTKCLQAINNSIQQFNQHLKAEKLDRQIIQLIVLQLQNDFAVLRYLLFSSTETIPNKDITVKDTTTSPFLNFKANPNPTSSAFPLPGPGEPKHHRATPVGAVGLPRTKTANADLQPSPNTQEAPSTVVQNLTSRICKLEKLFADEISAHTSITAGMYSQYFLFTIKFASLNMAIQMLLFGKFPQ